MGKSLEINSYDSENRTYESGISGIISFLLDNQIIERVFNGSNGSAESPYSINRNFENHTNYFIIPVLIDIRINIELIFRSRDLYLQGFLNNNHYYSFSSDRANTRNDDLLIYPNININNNHDLGFIGHYNILMGTRDQEITWNNIHFAFFALSNFNGATNQVQNLLIKAALGRVILATSESIRFRSIFNFISINLIQNHGTIYWNSYAQNQVGLSNIVTNWDTNSRNFNTLEENLIEPQRNIAIISLGASLYYWNTYQNRHGKRDVNDLQNFCGKLIFKNLNNNQFCYIENKKYYYLAYNSWTSRKITEIKGQVTTTAIFQQDGTNKTNDNNIKASSLYIAKTKGLYYFYRDSWNPSRINGINEIVTNINLAPSGSAYFTI